MVSLLLVNTVLGIFSICAFALVSAMLRKYELPWRSWVILTMVALLLTVAEHARTITGDLFFYERIFTSAMVGLFLIAIVQFWSVVQLGK